MFQILDIEDKMLAHFKLKTLSCVGSPLTKELLLFALTTVSQVR